MQTFACAFAALFTCASDTPGFSYMTRVFKTHEWIWMWFTWMNVSMDACMQKSSEWPWEPWGAACWVRHFSSHLRCWFRHLAYLAAYGCGLCLSLLAAVGAGTMALALLLASEVRGVAVDGVVGVRGRGGQGLSNRATAISTNMCG